MARIASQFPVTDVKTGLPIVSEPKYVDIHASHKQHFTYVLSHMMLGKQQRPDYERATWGFHNESERMQAVEGARSMSEGAIQKITRS